MEIEQIAKKIQDKGGRLYLVGGALRDSLLKKANKDEDYCVTGFSKEKFLELFPKARMQGKSFPVFSLENREFALARKENKCGIGHQEFLVDVAPTISIQEDLARRDITINAMAKDVLTGKIWDPFGGMEDLKQGRIRATTSHFKEDPLRVYRVARLAASLEFFVEEKTKIQMQEMKWELMSLSKERIFMELEKALQSQKPSIFFEVLKETQVLDVHFKEIADLIGVEQPAQYHPEGDAYEHTKMVLDNACILTKDVVIRFAALVHDLGKGTTPKQEYPHHYGHEQRGVGLVEELANRLALPNKWKECGKVAAKEHMRGGIFNQMTVAKKVSFIERIDKTSLGLEGLFYVVLADRLRFRYNTRGIRKNKVFRFF